MLVILPSWRKWYFQVKGVSYLWLHTCLEFLRSYEISSRPSAFKLFLYFLGIPHETECLTAFSLFILMTLLPVGHYYKTLLIQWKPTSLRTSEEGLKANCICFHTITESQNGWGWRAPPEVIWSTHPAQAGPPRPGCPGPCPEKFWLSLRMETPQSAWATQSPWQ